MQKYKQMKHQQGGAGETHIYNINGKCIYKYFKKIQNIHKVRYLSGGEGGRDRGGELRRGRGRRG
jgi:hypothetical protein